MEEVDKTEAELLLQIKLGDGSTIDIKRKDGDVIACKADHCLILPGSPGHQTLDLVALLEDQGEIVEGDESAGTV